MQSAQADFVFYPGAVNRRRLFEIPLYGRSDIHVRV